MMNDLEIPEPSIEEIEENLYNTRWREEAKQLPLEFLQEHEQYLMKKYINNEPETPEEKQEIKKLLRRFRPAIQEIQPEKLLENVEQNVQYINDENTFLSLVDESEEVQVIPFTFYIGQKKYQMKFDLYSLTDSQAITDITENLSMFQDMDEDELITYSKIQNGEKLSREEMLIRVDLEQKIQKATIQNTRETLIEFLSLQLKFHGQNSSIESMRKVFRKIPNAYLSLLFDEVQKRNHLGDIEVEDVFQPFD